VISRGHFRVDDRSGGVLILRQLLIGHRGWAGLLFAAALLMKLLVPAGYMVSGEQGRFQVMLCSGVAPAQPVTVHHGMDRGAMAHHDSPKQEHDRAEMPCAFAGLALQALGGADPILLAAAIAFIVAVALRPAAAVPLRRGAYVRPPLRGPPVHL
jgi:hypothetical protein